MSLEVRIHFTRGAWPFALLALLAGIPAGRCATPGACRPVVFEGEVRAGQAYLHPLSTALDWKLEAVPAGWMVRVLPHAQPRPLHDAAELANPPYQSPTPLLISTDFAFRAQDAVAWNPRSFHFFTTPDQVAIAESAFQAIQREPNRPSAGSALYQLLPRAADGEFRILDAELAGGTANQTAAAATVASHFAETAHRVRPDLPPTPLGRLLALRFRVTVQPGRLLPGCP